MGLYDNLKCNYPLPDNGPQDIEYQTKDLENYLGEYELTVDGKLIEHCWEWESTPKDELKYPDMPFIGCMRKVKDSHYIKELDFTGILNFYGDKYSGELILWNFKTGEDELHPGPKPEWFEFVATFIDGQLINIERIKCVDG